MKQCERIKYESPVVEIMNLKMEHAVVAGSSIINTGEIGNEHTPEVMDWDDSGSTENKDFDL